MAKYLIEIGEVKSCGECPFYSEYYDEVYMYTFKNCVILNNSVSDRNKDCPLKKAEE
jgi:hypothetical protein